MFLLFFSDTGNIHSSPSLSSSLSSSLSIMGLDLVGRGGTNDETTTQTGSITYYFSSMSHTDTHTHTHTHTHARTHAHAHTHTHTHTHNTHTHTTNFLFAILELLRPMPRHFSRCGANLAVPKTRLHFGQVHSTNFLTSWGVLPNISNDLSCTISVRVHKVMHYINCDLLAQQTHRDFQKHYRVKTVQMIHTT